jgi:hypothetical protein
MAEQEEPLNTQRGMKRREFIRTASGAALGLTTGGIISSLAGCGGGNTGAQVPDVGGTGTRQLATSDRDSLLDSNLVASRVTTRVLRATVNTTHIGGTGLRVQSAYSRDGAPASDGKFPITVSAQGFQLVSVTDAQKAVRGLALSDPRSTLPINFDATSTALSLVMMTPGILETDPARGAARVAEIKAYPSFTRLVSFLVQNLKTIPLSALRRSPALESVKGAVISDWRRLHGGVQALSISTRATNSQAQFSADYGTGILTAKPVKLTNRGWRLVRVDRELLDAQGRRLRLTQPVINQGRFPLDTMGGATPISWGALLQQNVGSPTEETDTLNLLETIPPVGQVTPSRIATVRYYISGPGVGLGSEKPNFSINYANAVGQSVLFALVLPLADLVMGGAGLLGKVGASMDLMWTRISTGFGSGTFISSLTNAMNSNNPTAAYGAALDMALAMFGVIGVALGAVEGLGLTATAIVLVAQAVAYSALCFSAVNVGWTVANWLRYPAVSKIELPVSSGTVIVR